MRKARYLRFPFNICVDKLKDEMNSVHGVPFNARAPVSSVCDEDEELSAVIEIGLLMGLFKALSAISPCTKIVQFLN
jgi:hypothetical protein